MSSVTQCISYFSRYGLKSLNDTTSDDEHSPLPDIPYMVREVYIGMVCLVVW